MTFVNVKPSEEFEFMNGQGDVLLIACGALAREIVDLIERNRWQAFDVTCLPANGTTRRNYRPAIRDKIRAAKGKYRSIFVLYGDCGTGGQLDQLLEEEGVERIGGPHCYAFFSGNDAFAAKADDDFTAFFLTDYLARHFDKLIWDGLGLDRIPNCCPCISATTPRSSISPRPAMKRSPSAPWRRRRSSASPTNTAIVGYGELASEMKERLTSTGSR